MTDNNLLIIEDDESISSQMKWAFHRDYGVYLSKNRQSGVAMVKAEAPEVVILDLGLPPKPLDVSEGFRALEDILEVDPLIKILVVTGQAERGNALKAMDLGAFDFITKPISIDEMRVIVKRAFHVYALEKENMGLREAHEADGLGELLGTSGPMQEVFALIRKVSTADVPILILGETGTGKELAARAIHRLSERSNGPFVAINCGAIPGDLLESELFGHEKGAFTGAYKMKPGKFELADTGTLFLDEIGELRAGLQVKLLRFLQDHAVERIGGRRTIQVDLRVIAATNRDLLAMTAEGSFREDLYFRLGVVSLRMPPLRERGDDIDLLAITFLKRHSRGLKIQGFSRPAVSALRKYPWPGNVRELENRIKRAVTMAQGRFILPKDLDLSQEGPAGADKTGDEVMGLLGSREAFEKRVINEALLKHKGIVSRAATELKISRQYLSKLIKKHKIKPKGKKV